MICCHCLGVDFLMVGGCGSYATVLCLFILKNADLMTLNSMKDWLSKEIDFLTSIFEKV